MQSHNIYALFVPAACTDMFQECDTVVNKPFKNGLKAAFRDHLHHLFQVHIDKGFAPAAWSAKLTMGELKPFVTSFVEVGISGLKTPEMKLTIARAFENDGLFKIIRSDERQEIAAEESAERTIAESNLTLPITFGQLRRHLNLDSLNAVLDQIEDEQEDEEIGADGDSSDDEDDFNDDDE
jgi:hypothetical protein